MGQAMSNNDFTLDELNELYYRLESSLQCRGDKDELNLLPKLSKLIDEYCDHEFEQAHIEIEIEYCIKCGVQAI